MTRRPRIKVGTLLDEQLYQRSKQLAVRKDVALNRLVEMALEAYLNADEESGLLSLQDVLEADQASHATEGSGRGAGDME